MTILFALFAFVACFGAWIGGPGLVLTYIFGWTDVTILVVMYIDGSFRPCKKCGLRFTNVYHDNVPDVTNGSNIMHPRVTRVCKNPKCKHIERIIKYI